MNMRIDIIRKELERRYEEIKNFQGDFKEERDRLIINFLHALFSEPFLKEFLLSLARFHEDFKSSEKFKQIKINVMEAVKNIINEIDRVGLIDKEFGKIIKGKQANFDNPFQLSGPDIVDGNLSLDQYLQALREFEKHAEVACTEWGLESIEHMIKTIFENASIKSSFCRMDIIQNSLGQIFECKRMLIAFLRRKAEYDGADSLINLLPVYLLSEATYLSTLKDNDFGDVVRQTIERHRISPPDVENFDTIQDCKNLYHAIDKFLMSSESKSFLMSRLLTYCRWIKKDEFPKPKEKNRELKISRVIEEFLFNHGYFPLVNFKIGKSIPDILSAPGIDLRWNNSVLIELKQIIGKTSYTPTDLKTDIGQAQDYLSDVKGVNPDIVDTVYLLIFYDGKTRQTIPESVDVPDNVRVEFVYVGEESPSELRAPKILKAPKTAAKKKMPKKKAAKKATRKK